MNWIKHGLGLSLVGTVGMVSMAAIARAEQPLGVVYPDDGHETTASRIFLIGTAAPGGEVTVNGQPIERSPAGHFAPSFPLELGENVFTLRRDGETLVIRVVRVAAGAAAPVGASFAEGSLWPAVDVARQPGETVCFGAIAPPNATVSVSLAGQTLPLAPQPSAVDLPPNSAVLTDLNQPAVVEAAQRYQGCLPLSQPILTYGNAISTGAVLPNPTQTVMLGQPDYQLQLRGETVRQTAPGSVSLLPLLNPPVVQVVAASGTARTGPSTDYSRLTPLPQGTRDVVTGREGGWLRLGYGAWIRESETQPVPNAAPPQTLIRGVRSRPAGEWTEIVFPLQAPVPVSLHQGDRTLSLTLHHTVAQTDTIFVPRNRLIQRFDWQQISPTQVQYTVQLNSRHQWGYKLRYEGTSLVLSLRNPPVLSSSRRQPLTGLRIFLDPGHGGPDDLGARGPTGYPEKDVALIVSKLLRDRLQAKGATVIMSRTEDIDLGPNERAAMIVEQEPHLALSIHYNALPDDGDAINTAGIGTFWYQNQAQDLAEFLHDYLVETRDRPSYGVFWNNLALTRPAVAPSVLLELGFMINPFEFEWIVDSQEQARLADALADGIEAWLQRAVSE
ncbi:N-acetylmuramoyl-L-alanine amidase [Thermoleptolyngbya sp. C42_A2020_037]|uniref:N-acetylmuramoyl-L-alanine amidase n=1 Tax=Thermoleptolyngbya sp. C42_A2020_037 TaxID=2747799 RepID=UPI0019E4AF62|nr:N-acetylmuramoyl-L-alanine amidase [Thermoleptolyngbya sp. C42_A2020_037]MBF2083927.1 N-acetylmuramoyl-L-alanine amidase [Thermoleptolyngbya sp. C42_A2020_037]